MIQKSNAIKQALTQQSTQLGYIFVYDKTTKHHSTKAASESSEQKSQTVCQKHGLGTYLVAQIEAQR